MNLVELTLLTTHSGKQENHCFICSNSILGLTKDSIATLFGRLNEDNQNIYIDIVIPCLSGLLAASEPTSNGLLGLVGLVNRVRGLTTLIIPPVGI